MSGLGVKVEGVDETQNAIRKFGHGVTKIHTLKAVSAGAGVIKPEVEKRASVETGTLKRSFIIKARSKRGNGEAGAYALIGANRRIKTAVSISKGGKLKTLATYRTKKNGEVTASGEKRLDKAKQRGATIRERKPSRYLHLANNGTRGRTGPRFLEGAASAKMQEAIAKFKSKLQEGIDYETRQAAREKKAWVQKQA